MFKLIKAEIYKIFHKKSTYITLLIAFLFLILVNYIYKNMTVLDTQSYALYLTEQKELLKNTNGDNPDIIDLNTNITVYSYLQKYNYAWEQQLILEDYYNLVYDYNRALFYKEDSSTYLEAKTLFEEKMAQEDFRYFYQEKLNISEEILKEKSLSDNAVDLEIAKRNVLLYEYAFNHPNLKDNEYLFTAFNNLVINNNSIVNYELLNTPIDNAILKEYNENIYILEHFSNVKNDNPLRDVFINLYSECEIIIFVFIIMISGSIVSEEFNKGTIKGLLTLPYKRRSILLAKFISCLLMIPFIGLFLWVAEFIIGGLFYGFSALNIPFISYSVSLNKMFTVNVIVYYLLTLICKMPMLIILATFSFMISTVILNTAFSITITFLFYIGSGIINSLVASLKFNFLKYFVTPNWDLSYYLFNGSSPYNNSLLVAIIISGIYFIIFLSISLWVFKKRNVKNI